MSLAVKDALVLHVDALNKVMATGRSPTMGRLRSYRLRDRPLCLDVCAW